MAGLAAQLQHIKSLYFGPSPAKGVMQDLEYAMRTKGGLTPEEEKTLRVYKFLPAFSFFAGSVWGTLVGWFSFGKGLKLLGLPLPPNPRFGSAREIMHQCPAMLLNTEEGRMKMELANIILNKHSDDAYLVNAVKRHFFAEHLFDDLHQDQPLFRWHPRRSYIDGTFVERMKEVEAANSDGVARSIAGETNANTTPFGDLMEDSLACVLGSSGCNLESNNPPEKTGTVLKRSELRARRRGRRHHHRHADD
ncbi:uncharacterized protein LOC8064881 isoform X2 [Sorghum bicolor]|uniref:uncharacterized protein LOC8064881 isoform X2 n=1 Tax=Sorghum bicolor TaxID=4558 RepID=UPI000B423857|nr:uncharacterized protein LOC8064881 isoform X2 [Sorghum bicolor]|eukprot:XP_021307903.1 uncharacterized protein LOC8064881 isoform X2 [Sorghum bicolor]